MVSDPDFGLPPDEDDYRGRVIYRLRQFERMVQQLVTEDEDPLDSVIGDLLTLCVDDCIELLEDIPEANLRSIDLGADQLRAAMKEVDNARGSFSTPSNAPSGLLLDAAEVALFQFDLAHDSLVEALLRVGAYSTATGDEVRARQTKWRAAFRDNQARLFGHSRWVTIGQTMEEVEDALRSDLIAKETVAREITQVLGNLLSALAERHDWDWADVPVESIIQAHTRFKALVDGEGTRASDKLLDQLTLWADAIAWRAETLENDRRLRVAAKAQVSLARINATRVREEARSLRQTTQREVAREADVEQKSSFEKLADKLRWRARLLLTGTVGLLAGSASAAYLLQSSAAGWQDALLNYAAAVPFLLLALYMGRESSHDRKQEDACRRLATQLDTLDGFSEPLTEDQQRELRLGFGKQLFTITSAAPGQDMNALPVEAIQALEALIRTAQRPQ